MLLGLDAFGEHDSAGAFGFGVHGVDDRRDVRAGVVLDQRQVQLDHVGLDQRQQCQRRRVGADVVQGDAPTQLADPGDGLQQLRGLAGQGPLGQFQHDGQG